MFLRLLNKNKLDKVKIAAEISQNGFLEKMKYHYNCLNLPNRKGECCYFVHAIHQKFQEEEFYHLFSRSQILILLSNCDFF